VIESNKTTTLYIRNPARREPEIPILVSHRIPMTTSGVAVTV